VQDDRGLRRLLTQSWAYSLFQRLVGARSARDWLVGELYRIEPGTRVLDMGCGPASILEHLPPAISYAGFDISESYIESARRRFGSRGTFLVGRAADFLAELPPRMKDVDLVICTGVLHHLDDAEASTMLALAHASLRPGGRFVGLEPAHLVQQDPVSRWVTSRDRGQAIRQEAHWKRLLGGAFSEWETHVTTGLLRIPYTHIVLIGVRAGHSE